MSNEKHDQDNTDNTDTEGHMPYRRHVEPAGEDDTVADTDGHRFKRTLEDAGEDDTVGDTDTEGHRYRRG